MMNLTGDGNGIDLVTMPQSIRDRVPTSNFFQRGGYERNGIARRTGTVPALYAEMNGIMDRSSQQPGAKELARRSRHRVAARGERITALLAACVTRSQDPAVH